MIYQDYNPSLSGNQLVLPGFAPMLPGYPIRGLMRCCVLCHLHGWPHLGRLASWQLTLAIWKAGQP